jgi:protocatechuate 3,4-dioxygenase alpha subunit
MLSPTTSQTVGPYLHIGLDGLNCADLTTGLPATGIERLLIEGRIVDGVGQPVPDALVEVWQADTHGIYRHVDDPRFDEARAAAMPFVGFGRIPTEPDGSFRFTTVKPGRVAGPDGTLQAPHIVVSLFMRGLLKHLSTRLYFADEAEANEKDWILNQVPAARRGTLIAQQAGAGLLRWEVVLQGAGETVFFDL